MIQCNTMLFSEANWRNETCRAKLRHLQFTLKGYSSGAPPWMMHRQSSTAMPATWKLPAISAGPDTQNLPKQQPSSISVINNGNGIESDATSLNSLLIGGTGLDLQADGQASTGYVLARDAWGRGYATEALHAMVAVARSASISSVYALCHPNHKASVRVLEKCGFTLESRLSNHLEFPNLIPLILSDVLRYSTKIK
jgi:hypothetical protein